MEVILQLLRKIVILVFYGELLIRILGGNEYQKYMRYGLGIMMIAIALGPIVSIWNDGISTDGVLNQSQFEQKVQEMTRQMEGVEMDWEKK